MRAYRGRRIGFYSYRYRDVINTYGMSRTRYGIINSYRDPFVDLQTPAARSITAFSSIRGCCREAAMLPTCTDSKARRRKLALGMRAVLRV